jgi:hypothetical protein
MKTILILGLLASVAMVAPVASAHIVIYTPNNICGLPLIIGDAGSLPHAWIGVTSCPYDHGSVPAPAVGLSLP